MRRSLLPALVALTAAASPAAAQTLAQRLLPDPRDPITRVGTRGANFLEFGVGARAHALAGATTALAEGAAALYWNTAGAAGVQGIHGAFSYAELFDAGITHTFAGVLLPVGQGAVGFSFINFSSGDIPRTTERWPAGGDPVAGNTFQWNASAFGLHYARNITDRLAFGGAVKYAQEGIELAKATYVGVDLGTRFRTGLYGVTIGASLSNVGSAGTMRGQAVERKLTPQSAQNQFGPSRAVEFQFRTHRADMPTVFRFGLQTELLGGPDALIRPDPRNRVVFAADITDGIDTDIQSAVGFEYSFRELLYVRGGKRWFNELKAPWDFTDGLSAGFGLRLPALGRKLAFDYAYTGMGELRNVQVFSFEFGF